MSTRAEIHSHFHSSFPMGAQAYVVRATVEACVKAHRFAKQFAAEQRLDVVPAVRRAFFQQRLSELAIHGFDIQVCKTSGETSHYVMVESDRLVLVALTRSQLRSALPQAKYRGICAPDPQLDFFRAGHKRAKSRLFATYLFGGSLKNAEPTIGHIVFPQANGRLLHGSINLLHQHRDVVYDARAQLAGERKLEGTEANALAKPTLKRQDQQRHEE